MLNENRLFYVELRCTQQMVTGRNDRLIKTKMEKLVYY